MVGDDMNFKEELEIILNKELDALSNLKELSFLKTDMIIGSKIKDLEETTKKEEALINEIALLEEERERLFNTWGVAIVTPISDVIEKVPEDNLGLTQLKDKLTEVLEEIYLRNSLNNDLINENLDWIDFNMNLITSIHSHPSYGGKRETGSGTNIFDKKV